MSSSNKPIKASPDDDESKSTVQSGTGSFLDGVQPVRPEETSEVSHVFGHMAKCTLGNQCITPNCSSIKAMAKHWLSCASADCSVCGPFQPRTNNQLPQISAQPIPVSPINVPSPNISQPNTSQSQVSGLQPSSTPTQVLQQLLNTFRNTNNNPQAKQQVLNSLKSQAAFIKQRKEMQRQQQLQHYQSSTNQSTNPLSQDSRQPVPGAQVNPPNPNIFQSQSLNPQVSVQPAPGTETIVSNPDIPQSNISQDEPPLSGCQAESSIISSSKDVLNPMKVSSNNVNVQQKDSRDTLEKNPALTDTFIEQQSQSLINQSHNPLLQISDQAVSGTQNDVPNLNIPQASISQDQPPVSDSQDEPSTIPPIRNVLSPMKVSFTNVNVQQEDSNTRETNPVLKDTFIEQQPQLSINQSHNLLIQASGQPISGTETTVPSSNMSPLIVSQFSVTPKPLPDTETTVPNPHFPWSNISQQLEGREHFVKLRQHSYKICSLSAETKIKISGCSQQLNNSGKLFLLYPNSGSSQNSSRQANISQDLPAQLPDSISQTDLTTALARGKQQLRVLFNKLRFIKNIPERLEIHKAIEEDPYVLDAHLTLRVEQLKWQQQQQQSPSSTINSDDNPMIKFFKETYSCTQCSNVPTQTNEPTLNKSQPYIAQPIDSTGSHSGDNPIFQKFLQLTNNLAATNYSIESRQQWHRFLIEHPPFLDRYFYNWPTVAQPQVAVSQLDSTANPQLENIFSYMQEQSRISAEYFGQF